ncbi:RDD family protein [Candidatus Omnitrophota bacterium]
MNEIIGSQQNNQQVANKPAGFWIRTLAYIIDGLIFIPIIIFTMFNMFAWKSLFIAILMAVPSLIYKPLMESFKGATLGKMMCKLHIIDKDGKKISLAAAYIRFIPFLIASLPGLLWSIHLLSIPGFHEVKDLVGFSQFTQEVQQPLWQQLMGWIIFFDCVIIVFNKEKLALHDMMAKTFCVKKDK